MDTIPDQQRPKRTQRVETGCMAFKIRYHCGEAPIGDPETAASLEDAHKLIAAKAADLDHKADIAIIFRISPSGTEELEESRKLHT
jgi:hypothetical protein